MVRIDGHTGEGGGQILRTSLALAAVTGRAVEITDIRAGRRLPGMRPQHVLCAAACREVTGGLLEGAAVGSLSLKFEPGPVRPAKYSFDVSSAGRSAGAVSLVFQTLLPPLSFAPSPSTVHIKGGTHVAWSPCADYIRDVFLPAAARMNFDATFTDIVQGYYPAGGGEVRCTVRPAHTPLRPLSATERGGVRKITIRSYAAGLPASIAQRQLKRALERLKGMSDRIEGSATQPHSAGRGTCLFILVECGGALCGFSALGERGKRAEAVADEAADAALEYLGSTGALDPHLSDQVLLPMALAPGESTFTTTRLTGHLKTNIRIIESFLPVRFKTVELPGGCARVSVTGKAPGSF